MPYIPTAMDFEDNNQTNYIPSLADFDETSSPVNVPRGTENNRGFSMQKLNDSVLGDIGRYGENVVRHGGANLAQFGKNILNIPHSFNKNIPAYAPDMDVYKEWGVDPGIMDKLAVGGLEFMGPLGAARKGLQGAKFLKSGLAKNIAENAVAGGASAAIFAPEDKLKATALGTAIGIGAPLIGKGFDKAIAQPLAGWYARSSIPGLIERATASLKGLPPPEAGAAALKGQYSKVSGKNTANWANTGNLATKLDSQLAASKNPFDASTYTKSIDDYVGKIEGFTPAKKAQYKEALDFANEIKGLAPKNFEDVTLLRQNLNQFLKDFTTKRGLTKADRFAQDFVKETKDKLINDTLKANAGKVNPKDFSEFNKSWNAANRSHQVLQEFHKGIGKTGVLKPKQVLREGLKKGGVPDPAIIGEYMPKAGQTGISGFNQLRKLLGNKKQTQQVIQSYYLRNLLQNGGTTQDIAGQFGKLSPRQRQFIFGTTDQAKILDVTNKALMEFGRPTERHGMQAFGHHFLGFGIPGFLGTAAGVGAGLPWEEAVAVAGLPASLGYKGLKAGIGKFASPKSVEKAMKFREKGRSSQGFKTNAILQSLFNGMGAQQ